MSFCSCENQMHIEIVRGTTNSFGIVVTDHNGAPYVLEADQFLVFGIKINERDENRVLTKRITGSVDGQYYLELSPADTANLPIGQYYYDVGLQHGNHVFYNVIESSPFIIKPNITKLGDGA